LAEDSRTTDFWLGTHFNQKDELETTMNIFKRLVDFFNYAILISRKLISDLDPV